VSAAKRGAPGGATGGVEIIIFALLALGAGGTAIVWLAGNLASLLAGSGSLSIGPGEALDVLRRLPGTLDDPARAWPAAVRGELPGSTTLIVALVLAVCAVGALLIAVLWLLFRLQRRRAPENTAQWASLRDLRELHVSRAERGRLIVGRQGRQLLACERNASVMIVAPSQSHKTNGFVTPSILEWDGPVLATSVKGDLVHDTIAARSQVGETRVFDPTGATGLATAVWSPVAAATTWEGARRTAARLLEIGQNPGGSSDERFWRPAAARYLAPLLLAASRGDLTMGDVLGWIATTNEEEPR